LVFLKDKSSKFFKNERLRRREEFKNAHNKGIRYISKHFNLIVVPNENGLSRLGIIAGKKTGTAVKRNRIKRIVREIFRKNKILFDPYKDYVILTKKGAYELTYQEFFEELKPLLALSSQ